MSWRSGVPISTLLLILVLQIFLFRYPLRPKIVHANGHDFKVFYSSTYPEDLSKAAEEEHALYMYGRTTCISSLGGYIQINPTQSLSDMKDTVWHEAKHAASGCTDFDESSDTDDIYNQEGPQELQLMRDNPTLIRFISR